MFVTPELRTATAGPIISKPEKSLNATVIRAIDRDQFRLGQHIQGRLVPQWFNCRDLRRPYLGPPSRGVTVSMTMSI